MQSCVILLLATLAWVSRFSQTSDGAVLSIAMQEPAEGELEVEEGPQSMQIVFHQYLTTTTRASVSRLPTTASGLYDANKRIMTAFQTGDNNCFLRYEVAKIGELVSSLPPSHARKAFGIYQTCKQCVHVCGGRGLYFAPKPHKFCLVDVQGCTSAVVKCPKQKTSENKKNTRKQEDLICRYSKGCWCKFKRLEDPNKEKPVETSTQLVDTVSSTTPSEQQDGSDSQNENTIVFGGPVGEKNSSDRHSHHPASHPVPRPQPWVYENRVTIALLSVWLFCAVIYVGYNYKCVADACFGWIPCYQRLVGLEEENTEGGRRRRRRGRGRRHRHRREGDNQSSSPESSEGSPATPPRAHRARQINMETCLTTTSLPKYEDVVSSNPAVVTDQDSCAFEMGGISDIGTDPGLPTYEQATSMATMHTPSMAQRRSSCPTPVLD